MTICIKKREWGWEVFNGYKELIGEIHVKDTNVDFLPFTYPISLDDMIVITEFMKDQL